MIYFPTKHVLQVIQTPSGYSLIWSSTRFIFDLNDRANYVMVCAVLSRAGIELPGKRNDVVCPILGSSVCFGDKRGCRFRAATSTTDGRQQEFSRRYCRLWHVRDYHILWTSLWAVWSQNCSSKLFLFKEIISFSILSRFVSADVIEYFSRDSYPKFTLLTDYPKHRDV